MACSSFSEILFENCHQLSLLQLEGVGVVGIQVEVQLVLLSCAHQNTVQNAGFSAVNPHTNRVPVGQAEGGRLGGAVRRDL